MKKITVEEESIAQPLSGAHLESYKREVLQPNETSVWILGEDQVIFWNVSTIYGGYVRIFLQTSTAISSLYTITAEADNTGNFSWSDINFERDISTKDTFCGWPDTFIMRIYLSVFYENSVINFSSEQFKGIKPIHFTNLMNGALWVAHQMCNVTWDHSLSESLVDGENDQLVLQIVYLVAFNPSNPIGAYDWYPLVDLLEVNADDRVAEIEVPELEEGAIYGLKLYHPDHENSLFAITSLDYPIRICASIPSEVNFQHSSSLWQQGVEQEISFAFNLQNKGYTFLTAVETNKTDAEWIELNCGNAVSDCSDSNCKHSFHWLTTQSLNTNINYTVEAWWMPSNQLDLDATGYRVHLRKVTITPGAFFKVEEHLGSFSSYETVTIYYTTTFSSLSTIWVGLVKDEALYQSQEFPNVGNISIQIGSSIPSGNYNLRLWVYPCGDDVSNKIYEDASQGLFITNTAVHYENLITGMLISLGLMSLVCFILIMAFKLKRKSAGQTPRTIMGKAVPKIGRDYATFKKQRMNKFGFNDIFESQTTSGEEKRKHDHNPPRNPWRRMPETRR